MLIYQLILCIDDTGINQLNLTQDYRLKTQN